MFSLLRRFEAWDSSSLLRTDRSDDAPLLGGRAVSSVRAESATSKTPPCVFTPDHEWALSTLHRIVRSQSPSTVADAEVGGVRLGASAPEMFDPKFLSLLADLHEVRCDAPRLVTRCERMESSRAIWREFVRLLADLPRREAGCADLVLSALTAPHEGRAPCLLRLASGAVHDLPLATAMCDLLTALADARSIGPQRLRESLLSLDSPADARGGDALPKGMPSGKYTDFVGRLMGDGQGEWHNDGAIYAVGRLRDELLLPDREQVVTQYSATRWQKLGHFLQLCDALRDRSPWRPPAASALSPVGLCKRIDSLQRSLSTARAVDVGMFGSICDQLVSDCVNDALRQGWQLARERHELLYMDQVSLPGTGLASVGPGGALVPLCIPALGRLPKVAPPQVVDKVTAHVLRDPVLLESLARAEAAGVSPACRELVAATARRHVEAELDLGDRLAGFLSDAEAAVYRVRLTSGGDTRRGPARQNPAMSDDGSLP